MYHIRHLGTRFLFHFYCKLTLTSVITYVIIYIYIRHTHTQKNISIQCMKFSRDRFNTFLILLCSLHVMFTLLRILLPTSSYVMDGYLKRLCIRTLRQLFILYKLNSMH